MKIERMISVTLFCLMMAGCAADDIALRERVSALEGQVQSLAEASIKNSNAIENNSNSISNLNQIIKILHGIK